MVPKYLLLVECSGKLEQKILDEEGIKLEDFECPKTPKLGSHGLRRALRFKIWDVSAVKTSEGIINRVFNS